MRNFPIDPSVKIAHFLDVMSIDMTLPKCASFTMEVYGEIICILSNPAGNSFLLTLQKTLTHTVPVSVWTKQVVKMLSSKSLDKLIWNGQ